MLLTSTFFICHAFLLIMRPLTNESTRWLAFDDLWCWKLKSRFIISKWGDLRVKLPSTYGWGAMHKTCLQKKAHRTIASTIFSAFFFLGLFFPTSDAAYTVFQRPNMFCFRKKMIVQNTVRDYHCMHVIAPKCSTTM